MSTIETKNYEIKPFTSLHIGGPGKVFLQQGTVPELTIEAPKDAFEMLEVTNENDQLSINIRPSSFLGWIFNFGAMNLRGEITYHVTVTDIEKLSFGGSLNIEAGTINTENLKISNGGSVKANFAPLTVENSLKISNSGSVHAVYESVEAAKFEFAASGSVKAEFDRITCEDLNTHASGSIKFTANSGNVTHQKVSISGSGSYNAVQLTTQTAELSISGSGKASVWAEQKLSLSVSGSGNIQYQGNAEVNQRVSGSGNVKKIEPAMG